MSDRTLNYQVALGLIREAVGLPPQASPSEVVEKVRALKRQTAKPSQPDPQLRGTRDHRIS